MSESMYSRDNEQASKYMPWGEFFRDVILKQMLLGQRKVAPPMERVPLPEGRLQEMSGQITEEGTAADDTSYRIEQATQPEGLVGRTLTDEERKTLSELIQKILTNR